MFRIFSLIMFLFPFVSQAKEPANDIQTKKQALSKTTRISSEPMLDVIEKELRLLRNVDIDKAYNDYTTKAFRQKTSLDEFKGLISKYNILSHIALFQFQSFYIENDIVTVGGELHSKTGSILPVEFDFVMEDNEWKIMGIQIFRNELPLPANGS